MGGFDVENVAILQGIGKNTSLALEGNVNMFGVLHVFRQCKSAVSGCPQGPTVSGLLLPSLADPDTRSQIRVSETLDVFLRFS